MWIGLCQKILAECAESASVVFYVFRIHPQLRLKLDRSAGYYCDLLAHWSKALSCDEYIVGSWSEGKFKPAFSAKLDHSVADSTPTTDKTRCSWNRSTFERVRDVSKKFADYWGRLLRTNYGKAPEQHTEQS
jgi:hypothetical protein